MDVLIDHPAVARSSPDAWRCVRIEYALPEFGTDFGTQDNPHEASLDRRAVSWSKGCYLGQEVVCMQDMRGKVKRRVVRLDADGPAALAAGTPVLAGSETVGEITSSCRSADDSRVRSLARVLTKALEGGVELRAAGRVVRAAGEPR
ncbi:MAG TPA: folate-binding protein YgfZ, partial [Polyangiaceae bacterium]|nr:folate-binding protein YgfZ [Polyangiaceae bacterium]